MSRKEETKYVDGFVFRISEENVSAYKKIAKKSARIWMKHGALSYKECMIDEPDPEWAAFTFPKLTKAKPGETIWFSYVEYKSKAHRNAVNKKVMADPEMQGDMQDMPFDMKKMAFGGFKVVVGS